MSYVTSVRVLPMSFCIFLFICGMRICAEPQTAAAKVPESTIDIVLSLRPQYTYKCHLHQHLDTNVTRQKQIAILDTLSAEGISHMILPNTLRVNGTSFQSTDFAITYELNPSADQKTFQLLLNNALDIVIGKDLYDLTSNAGNTDTGNKYNDRPKRLEQIGNVILNRLVKVGYKGIHYDFKSDGRITMKIPGVADMKLLKRIITTPGHLEIRILPNTIIVTPAPDSGKAIITRDNLKPATLQDIYRESMIMLDGSSITDKCDVYLDEVGKWGIRFTVQQEYANIWSHMSATNINRQTVIIVDNTILTAPVIMSELASNGVITGAFTETQAKEIANYLNAGMLEAPVGIEKMTKVD